MGRKRVGLYYHLQEETQAGRGERGGRRNDLTYAVSLAPTWGNATTFGEGYGRTDLDGRDAGRSLITVTPGIRATFAHRPILMAGVEFLSRSRGPTGASSASLTSTNF